MGTPLKLRKDRQALVVLSPDLLTKDGFSSITVNNGDGSINIPANVSLTTPAFGSVTLTAANLDVEGHITAPSGTLSFTTYNYSPFAAKSLLSDPAAKVPPPDPSRGVFTLGSSASLSTAGLIVDDRPGVPGANTLPLATSGGSITIDSYTAILATGSTITASGGAAVSATGKVTYVTGGSISISAGEDPNVLGLLGGKLVLNSVLAGYSGSTGGSLSIQAPSIQIGGTATSDPNTLFLSPAFFSQGGFVSFTLTGLGKALGDPTGNDLPGF